MSVAYVDHFRLARLPHDPRACHLRRQLRLKPLAAIHRDPGSCSSRGTTIVGFPAISSVAFRGPAPSPDGTIGSCFHLLFLEVIRQLERFWVTCCWPSMLLLGGFAGALQCFSVIGRYSHLKLCLVLLGVLDTEGLPNACRGRLAVLRGHLLTTPEMLNVTCGHIHLEPRFVLVAGRHGVFRFDRT